MVPAVTGLDSSTSDNKPNSIFGLTDDLMFVRGMITVLLTLIFQSSVYAEDLIIRPLPQRGPLDNPLKGWCPYTDAGKIYQPYSMVFQYVSWKALEPQAGVYRFEEWEKSWDSPLGKDKHIIFRVYIDYPSLPSGLPDWLREAGIKETKYDAHGGGLSPDYNDPKLITALESFIRALGENFNQHPRVAFIQLGVLGYWGEWHTWPREELYASAETEQKIIEAYRRAFPDKKLMVRYARDYAGQQEWIGFHDDMFPEDTDNGEDWSFLAGVRKSGRTENWKGAVVGGEMVPNQAKRWLTKDFETTAKMLKATHFSWIGPYCPALEKSTSREFEQRSQQLVRMMGYEYELTELQHAKSVRQGESLSLQLQGENNGVAPFYYPWSVELALLDSSGKAITITKTNWDIRKWLPGDFDEQTTAPLNVPPGKYQLAIGIRDPWKDEPAIKFANRLKHVHGWTIVSEVTVLP